jgi:hypothetical protein
VFFLGLCSWLSRGFALSFPECRWKLDPVLRLNNICTQRATITKAANIETTEQKLHQKFITSQKPHALIIIVIPIANEYPACRVLSCKQSRLGLAPIYRSSSKKSNSGTRSGHRNSFNRYLLKEPSNKLRRPRILRTLPISYYKLSPLRFAVS